MRGVLASRRRSGPRVEVGDLICNGRFRITMVKNPDASMPIVSAIDDRGEPELLAWNGYRWDRL